MPMITDLKVSIFLLNGDREQKQLLHPTLLTTVNWKEKSFASAPQHMTHFKSRLGQPQPNFRTLPLQLHSPAHAQHMVMRMSRGEREQRHLSI